MDFKAPQNLSEILMGFFDKHSGGHDESMGIHYVIEYIIAEKLGITIATFDWDDGGDIDELIMDHSGNLFYYPTDGDTPPIRSQAAAFELSARDPVIKALKKVLEAA